MKLDISSSTVSDFYRKFIMSQSTHSSKDKLIETFENYNILKYSHKSTPTSNTELPYFTNNTSL